MLRSSARAARTTNTAIRASRIAPVRHASQQSSTPPSSSQPQLLRNAAIATGLLGAAAASYYYSDMQTTTTSVAEPEERKTFTSRIKTSKGIVEHQHDLLTAEQCDKRLHENEFSVRVPTSAARGVVRWDSNWVASNDPMEDRHAEDVVPRQTVVTTKEIDSNAPGIKLFSIIDGHGGWATSELVSRTLHPMIVLSLRSLYAGNKPEVPASPNASSSLHILSYVSSVMSGVTAPIKSLLAPSVTVSQNTISDAIKSAFLTLDEQICSSPLRLLPHIPAKPGKPSVRPIVMPMMEPALSGCVAITMLVDEEREELYVASTGDCRAVAGYWIDGEGWRYEPLSEDMMGENPQEIKRMQSEHPSSEKDTVIMRGRVMGGLQPTRAFGDARYKWTREQHEGVNAVLPDDHDGKRRPSPYSKTPPYVTARPEVTVKTLKGEDGKGVLRFVVLATDGLWDRISSAEAVALVAAHMEDPTHAPAPAAPMAAAVRPLTASSATIYPPATEGPGVDRTGDWVFEDENVATHLIKNSLSGGNVKKRNELLSMKPPVSRWLRDDITCTVVFFGDKDNGDSMRSATDISDAKTQAALEAGSPPALAPVKARL